ncbi:hypothetical protein, partial [uncultured Helicobacter sp.]|uniref:hypothetical protein n=1 Tax=uncultured Helicobacter sp. TaxID=175537 RepID=UPI0026092F99
RLLQLKAKLFVAPKGHIYKLRCCLVYQVSFEGLDSVCAYESLNNETQITKNGKVKGKIISCTKI